MEGVIVFCSERKIERRRKRKGDRAIVSYDTYFLIKLSMKTGDRIIPSVISSTNNDVSCYRGITDIIFLDFFKLFLFY